MILTVSDFTGNTAFDNITITVIEIISQQDTDSDNDSYNDTFENASGSDPYNPMSTPFDIDGDGWNNTIETQVGTNPYEVRSIPPDMDGDGETDLLDSDRDGDGILNEDDAYPINIYKWEREEEETERKSDVYWVIGALLVVVIIFVVVLGVMLIWKGQRGNKDWMGSSRDMVEQSIEEELGLIKKFEKEEDE